MYTLEGNGRQVDLSEKKYVNIKGTGAGRNNCYRLPIISLQQKFWKANNSRNLEGISECLNDAPKMPTSKFENAILN